MGASDPAPYHRQLCSALGLSSSLHPSRREIRHRFGLYILYAVIEGAHHCANTSNASSDRVIGDALDGCRWLLEILVARAYSAKANATTRYVLRRACRRIRRKI